jgi:hypothetical protein
MMKILLEFKSLFVPLESGLGSRYKNSPFLSTELFTLPTPSFAIVFSAKKQTCRPEARALRGESIGPVISDSWLPVAGFSLLVPSLPILYSFNQQQGTSNQELIFQSAFRNRNSAIWRGPKGLVFLSERSRGNRFLRPAPAGAVREPPLHRPSFLNHYTQPQIR